MGKPVKKLIIVCDEKTKEYANYLRQLISVNDDKGDDIVGIADGSVDAAVWTDKEYSANSAKISSNEHILFLGENKVSKSETSSMLVKFDKFGMKYGWLGKRGMLIVNNQLLAPEEYDQFVEYCTGYEAKFEKIVMKKPKVFQIGKKKESSVPEISAGEVVVDSEVTEIAEVDASDKKEKKLAAKGAEVAAGMAAVAGFVINPIVAVGAAGAAGVCKGVSQVTAHKKVKDQQYRALTAIMYMDALSEFMEG